jgi:hypothetical protein
MPPQAPNAEPTLDEILGHENFDQAFYDSPRQMVGTVISAAERRWQQQQQQRDVAEFQERNWRKFFAANPHLARAGEKEVRAHLMDQIATNPKLASYEGDVEGAFDMMAELGERYIVERKAQMAEADELSVYSGGPGAEGEVDPAELRSPPPLSNIIRLRRARRRGEAA